MLALSRQFPDRLMEHVMPLSPINPWIGPLVYWLP